MCGARILRRSLFITAGITIGAGRRPDPCQRADASAGATGQNESAQAAIHLRASAGLAGGGHRGLGVDDPEKPPIVVTADQEMALSRGRRIDPEPVLLTIHTATAQEMGALFKQYGETLYLTAYVPADAISGPPLPKEEPQRKKAKTKPRPQTPGSFALKPQRQPDEQDDGSNDQPDRSRDQRRRKEKQWQREKPPWRR